MGNTIQIFGLKIVVDMEQYFHDFVAPNTNNYAFKFVDFMILWTLLIRAKF